MASTLYEYYFCQAKTKEYPNQKEPWKSQYHHYILTFSALSNTKSLFEKNLANRHHTPNSDNRLNVVGALLLMFVVGEFIGRSYVLPVFLNMINIKRTQNGLTNEYFTSKKFIFIRSANFATVTYVIVL